MRRLCGNHREPEFHRVEVLPAETRLADEFQVGAVRVVNNHGNSRVGRAAGAAVVVDVGKEQRVCAGERLL